MWRYILTDLSLTPIGEVLNAKDRSMNWGLRTLPQTKFSVRMDNPMAESLAGSAAYLKIYRDQTLKFFGPVVSAEESADAAGASLACVAAGQAWVLTKRLAGKSSAGTQYPLQDRALTAQQILTATNTENPTRIAIDATSYSGSTATYLAGPYKPVSTCMSELSNLLDGFDWTVEPTEPDASGNIGIWTARPNLGIARPETIFEFGIGRHNIADYKVQISRDVQANQVINPGQGSQDPVSQIDSVSIAKWGLLEDIADLALEDATMRQKLVDEHIAVRSNPRRVVTFTPHVDDATGRVPLFGVDYDVGDVVTARAAIGRSVRFNGDFRVYGVQVDLDANGVERVTLTLTDDDSGS